MVVCFFGGPPGGAPIDSSPRPGPLDRLEILVRERPRDEGGDDDGGDEDDAIYRYR